MLVNGEQVQEEVHEPEEEGGGRRGGEEQGGGADGIDDVRDAEDNPGQRVGTKVGGGAEEAEVNLWYLRYNINNW